MADHIISPSEALAQGLKRYFTGTPCKRGHIAERYVDNRGCVACVQERNAARYDADAERIKARIKAYSKANRTKIAAYQKAYWAERMDKVRARTAKYRARNRDKVRAKRAAYKAANRERIAASAKAYRAANLEKCRASEARYRANNPEKLRAYRVVYEQDNREKLRSHTRNRRARKRAAEGHHTAEDIQRIYEAQNGKCAYCKVKVGKKFHVDHIKALTKGGSNWPNNLQILCGPCNIRKHNHDPIEHARSLGLLL